MKNTFASIALIMFFSLSSLVSHAQTKIATVNIQELIQGLPDYKVAEGKLKDYAKSLQDTYAAMQDEYNDKLAKYMKDSTKMTEPTKEVKRQELTDLVKRMQKMESTSDQSLQEKQNELLKPMQDKVMTAMKSVAKENGYSYIFDVSQGSNLVYYPEGETVTALVKKKLATP